MGAPAQRRTERDYLAYLFRYALAQLGGHGSTQAPANQADLLAGFFMDFVQLVDQMLAIGADGAGAKIAAQIPAICVIAKPVEIAPDDFGRSTAGHKARQHHDRVPIAARCRIEKGG